MEEIKETAVGWNANLDEEIEKSFKNDKKECHDIEGYDKDAKDLK